MKEKELASRLQDPVNLLQAGSRIFPEVEGLLRNDQGKPVVIEGEGFCRSLHNLAAPIPDGLFIEAPGKIDSPEGRINAIDVALRRFFQKTGNGLAPAAPDVKDFRIFGDVDLGQAPQGQGRIPQVHGGQQVSFRFGTGTEKGWIFHGQFHGYDLLTLL